MLDLLGQPGVLSMAGVSQHWRGIAKEHRDYYRFIDFQDPKCSDVKQVLRDKEAPLRVRVDYRPGRTIQVAVLGRPRGSQPHQQPPSVEELSTKRTAALLTAMSRVVKLELLVAQHHLGPILVLVRQPLPVLRHLQVSVPWRHYEFGPCPTLDFGASLAPRLTSLSLGNVQIPANTSAWKCSAVT